MTIRLAALLIAAAAAPACVPSVAGPEIAARRLSEAHGKR
jgi:hypothetical protein